MKIRIDKLITQLDTSLSRADAKNLIESGGVFAGGKQIFKPSEQVEDSASIKINENILAQIKKSHKIDLNPDSSIKFEIIYEDDDIAIIEKPAGLVVHPSHSHRDKTLASGLIAKWPQIRDVGEDPARPGIVHRLDKDVSGIMAIAKTNKGFFHLKKQFQDRTAKKTYFALVYGKPQQEEGIIENRIARSKDEPTKQVISAEGKHAITKYRVLSVETRLIASLQIKQSLIECNPLTGRMHQIRLHLASIGCPIVGDKKYLPKNLLKIDTADRIMLHAKSLEVELINGERKGFKGNLFGFR